MPKIAPGNLVVMAIIDTVLIASGVAAWLVTGKIIALIIAAGLSGIFVALFVVLNARKSD